MKEIKFTRVYGTDANGKKCVVGYKCSDERFEIRKCDECYDVYEDGMFECIFHRLKDAKREIATRIKWLDDEEEVETEVTTKTEAEAEDIADIEVVEKDGKKIAYAELKDEYLDLIYDIKEIATEDNPVHDLDLIVLKLNKMKNVMAYRKEFPIPFYIVKIWHTSPKTNLKTSVSIQIQSDIFGFSIVDIKFETLTTDYRWDYVEIL